MDATPVIAIIDVGKTNKKLFLFDEDYRIVYERSARFSETVDEDGFPCENLESLRLSVFDSLCQVFRKKEFQVKAVNFSTYGASFVYLDKEGMPVAPLYNYLKPLSVKLKEQFYNTYGGEEAFASQTASPVLGSLNSGMQLYRIKHEKPQLFSQIAYALHLPQYMSSLITGRFYSDITSIGCHTNLWDFTKNSYHEWVHKEGVMEKLAPLAPADQVVPATFPGSNYGAGIGLHDSSAALIPYLKSFHEPFVLISTGTWCVSLNPFNQEPLTADELASDCLYFMQYQGKPVKASRLFAGHEHEQEVKRISDHFNQSPLHYRKMRFNREVAARLQDRNRREILQRSRNNGLKSSLFSLRDLSDFLDDEEAYHQLMLDLVREQIASTGLVMGATAVNKIFVDGGFSHNDIYMNLLAIYLGDIEVYAASIAQATATGTAMVIHEAWNTKSLLSDIIKLKLYSLTPKAML